LAFRSGGGISSGMRTAVCVIVKNEEPNFLEWICFHLAAGFDTILVYDNHSTDRTFDIARAARAAGDVRVRRWERPSRQAGCYAHAHSVHRDAFDWMAFIDSDEFLFAPGHGSIKDFLADKGQIPAFGVHWLCYGSSGATEISEQLVIEEFVRRGPLTFSANRHIKTLLQPKRAIAPIGGHKFRLVDDAPYYSADGQPIIEWLKPEGKAMRVSGTDHLRINHYYTRSRAHYLRKLERGDVALDMLVDAFRHHDRNDEHDDSALVYRDKMKAMIDAVTAAQKREASE